MTASDRELQEDEEALQEALMDSDGSIHSEERYVYCKPPKPDGPPQQQAKEEKEDILLIEPVEIERKRSIKAKRPIHRHVSPPPRFIRVPSAKIKRQHTKWMDLWTRINRLIVFKYTIECFLYSK